MIPFPNIGPEIFSLYIFGYELSLRWYSVSYIMGFIFALLIMKYFIRRESLWRYSCPPLDYDQAENFLTYLIMGVIFGGRLGYVVFYNPSYYLNSPLEILQIWDGGMSFHGGFLGVVLSVILFCKRNGILLLSCADLIALSTPPGLFFGRIANFINAELWGRATDLPWGVVFPGQLAQNCPDVVGQCARHPSQLYEAGLEGLLLFILMIIFAHAGLLKKPGNLMGIFFTGYGLARFFVEYFRVPDPQFVSVDNPFGYVFFLFEIFGLTMGQLLSLPMIIIGISVIVLRFSRND